MLFRSDQGAVVGLGIEGDKLFTGTALAFDDLAFQRYRFDCTAFHLSQELRVNERRRLARTHAELAENREQYHREGDP